jgi:hypothetical protein
MHRLKCPKIYSNRATVLSVPAQPSYLRAATIHARYNCDIHDFLVALIRLIIQPGLLNNITHIGLFKHLFNPCPASLHLCGETSLFRDPRVLH